MKTHLSVPARRDSLLTRRRVLKWGLGATAASVLPTLSVADALAEKVQLQAWYNWSVSPAPLDHMKELASKVWGPAHDDSSIRFTSMPEKDRQAKYTAAFAAGNGPDLFTEQAYIYQNLDIAAALPDDLAQIYEDGIADVVKAYYKVPFYDADAKWYGVPFIPVGNMGLWLYYNTDHFEEAGLDPEKPPTTMTELWEYARKLVKVDGNGNVTRSGFAHQLAGDPGPLSGKFYPILHAYGGRLYDPKTEVAEGFVNNDGGIAALAALQKNCVGDDKVSSITLGLGEEQMARGQASMIFRESSFVGYFRDHAPKLNYKISYTPPEKEEGCGPTGSNWSLIVNQASKAPEAAFDFVRAMATPEYDLEVAKAAGQLPAWKVNWDSEYTRGRPDYNALQYTLEHAAGIFYFHPKSPEAAEAYGKLILEVARGDKEPEDAANEAAKTIDRILKS